MGKVGNAVTAARVASGDKSALTEPLLNSTTNNGGGGEDGEQREQLSTEENDSNVTWGDRLKFVAVLAGGGVAMGAWGASMAAIQKTVLYVSGGVGCVVAPPVAYREHKIARKKGLREFINLLRGDVNRLMVQNDILHNEINNLESEVSRLQASEEKLTEIANKQGMNVDKLVQLVDENEETLKQMKKLVKGKILQDMITVIVNADTNRDFKIDNHELTLLTLRLQTMFEAQGITMDTELFQEMVRFNPTLEGVLQTAKELVHEGEGDSVLFKFTDGKRLRDEVTRSFTKRNAKKTASRNLTPPRNRTTSKK